MKLRKRIVSGLIVLSMLFTSVVSSPVMVSAADYYTGDLNGFSVVTDDSAEDTKVTTWTWAYDDSQEDAGIKINAGDTVGGIVVTGSGSKTYNASNLFSVSNKMGFNVPVSNGCTGGTIVITGNGNDDARYLVLNDDTTKKIAYTKDDNSLTFTAEDIVDGYLNFTNTYSNGDYKMKKIVLTENIDASAVTEETTEAETEAPTEETTEAITEAPTEAETEAPTEETTEAITEAPTEAETEAPTEAETEAPTEATTEGTIEVDPDKAENFEVWLDDMADSGVVKSGEYSFGGSVLKLVPGIKGEDYTVPNSTFQGLERKDRKDVNAYKAGERPTECNGFITIPEAGSSVVFTPAANGMLTVYGYTSSFYRVTPFVLDESGAWVNESGYTYAVDENGVTTSTISGVNHDCDMDSDIAVESYSFKVEYGKKYVISTTGKTNNCGYSAFEFIKDEPIEISVSFSGVSLDGAEARFKDTALGTITAKASEDGTVTLEKNHTYEIKSSSVGKKITTNASKTFVCDGSAVALYVEDVNDVTLTGTITSNDTNFNPAVIQTIRFTSMEDSEIYFDYNGTDVITDGTYTVQIKPGDYDTTITANGYVTHDRVSVETTGTTTNEIYVELAFNGTYNLPDEVSAPASNLGLNGITPNNETSVKGVAGSTITVPVKGVQTVQVAGWHSGTWDINGQNSVTADESSSANSPVVNSYTTDGTETSVTVNITGDGANYLYWIKVTDVVEFKPEISVPGDYDTLTDAIEYIKTVTRPDGEEGRVTINLTADLQEQVLVDAPYVTINGDGHEINWYYGQTCKYYSVDGSGYYSETLFRDRYSKTEASGSLWGGVVIVKGDYFKAENVTFRNTFNYEVTDKEIEDGADQTSFGLRSKTDDVTAYAYKERSNALYVDAKHIECKNCNILSSQDTLGVNGERSGYYAYFKDCTIGGNVDYICGAGTMLFDGCELQWKTYSDTNNDQVGYICAPKSLPYIFRNCTVTSNGQTDGVLGSYGRTWGSNSTAYFTNTETNGLVNDTWGQMTSGDYDTAKFYEYNNTANGVDFQTTNGIALTDETEINSVTTDEVITTYFGSWIPTYYEASSEITTETTTLGVDYVASDDENIKDSYNQGETIFKGTKFTITAPTGGTDGAAGTVSGASDTGIKYLKDNYSKSGITPIVDASAFGGNATAKVRTAFAVNVIEDTPVNIEIKVNNTKEVAVFDSSNTVVAYFKNDTGADIDPYILSIDGTAGETYYVGGIGTSPYIYAVKASSDEETTETSTESTTEETTETPTESTTETPTESTTEAPTESTTEAPTESSTEAPTEVTTQARGASAAKAEVAGSNSIRFVAAVDHLRYKEVGFIFEANGKTARRSTTVVYDQIDGSELVAADFEGEGNRYLYGFTIDEIEDVNTSITVKSYSIDLNGNEVVSDAQVVDLASLAAASGLSLEELAALDGEVDTLAEDGNAVAEEESGDEAVIEDTDVIADTEAVLEPAEEAVEEEPAEEEAIEEVEEVEEVAEDSAESGEVM